ncbi:MAG: outer membrane beta-barrel protein [Hyphomicrobiales bacterium]|nr:outer membrane beta-barrel protein [Hyphomicrobiales bacterium]
MRILRTAAALAAFVGGVSIAQADGMYSNASYKDAVPAASFSWTGFYIGGSVGFGSGTTENNSDLEISKGGKLEEVEVLARRDGGNGLSIPLVSEDSDLNGGVYGLHIGYNLQRGHMVYGLEATISGAEFDSSTSCGFLALFKCESDLDYYGTVVARLGYAVDKTLFYVVGGLAYGEVNNDLSLEALGFKLPLVEESDTAVGWTAGVGIEHAMSKNFIIRIEYAHIDLGDNDASKTFGLGGVDLKVSHHTDLEFDTIRIGASYKLDDRHAVLEP